MNSGGGDPQAGSELSQALKRQNKTCGGEGFAYLCICLLYGVLNADEIIAASEYSNIGSIGAFISVNSKFLKEYSEQIIDIYATNSPNKMMYLGVLAGDYTAAQRSIDSLAQIFQNDVKNTRKLSENILIPFSGVSGKPLEAKRGGLIDSIGSKNYAIKRIINYLNSKSKK